MKKTRIQAKKSFQDYYKSLNDQELAEAIKSTQERLKIMLLIAKEKNTRNPILSGFNSSPTPLKEIKKC